MKEKTLAIIVAAGRGRRMESTFPKQYRHLGEKPLLLHSLAVLAASPLIDEIFLVVPGEDVSFVGDMLEAHQAMVKVICLVPGGAERQESVWNALMASRADHGLILIHDAARPFITADLLERVLAKAAQTGAAIAALPIRDTVKRQEENGFLLTMDRAGLWLAQTPQAFRREMLLAAHRVAREDSFAATDDAACVERLGFRVDLVPGSTENIKLTVAADFLLAEALLKGYAPCE